jgi:acetyl esterase/lipase
VPSTRLVVAAAVAAVAAIAGLAWAALQDDTPPAYEHLATTVDYEPGRAADVYLPDRAGRAPVVVLVPGGGWRSAERDGLAPLADRLADAGMMAVNVTYRAADDGARFPAPVQDVDCAVRFAAARAEEVGIDPEPLLVLGHSSGAHLSALVALAGDRLDGPCRWPRQEVDGLVGLAGPYDVATFSGAAEPLFGTSPADDPDGWRRGNPMTWAGQHPQLAALLAHGDADDVVRVTSTRTFAAALRDAGHPVRESTVAGADHAEIYQAEVIAPTVVDWVKDTWPGSAPPAPSTPGAPTP